MRGHSRFNFRSRLISAVAAVAAAVGLGATAGTVDAGAIAPTDEVTIIVAVGGSQAASAATYVPSFDAAGSGALVGSCTVEPETGIGTPGPFGAFLRYTCTVTNQDTYTVSLPDPPAPFVVDSTCTDDTGTVAPGDQLVVDTTDPDITEPTCFFFVIAPMIILDKEIFELEDLPTGPLDSDDFLLEVYPAAGGAPIATVTDPSPDLCVAADEVGVKCGFAEVPFGEYVIGERSEYGYFGIVQGCTTDGFPGDGGGGDPPIITRSERLEMIGGAITISEESLFQRCLVANFYVEGTIEIAKSVVNDNGGTATPDDWTMELYDDTGALVTSAPCDADGTCLSGSFPIGEYTVGEIGPDGYVSSIDIEITEPVDEEALDDPDAVFELTPLATVDVLVVSDDQPTTTTLATTTDPSGATLPPTGGRALPVALLALTVFGLGWWSIHLTRRKA